MEKERLDCLPIGLKLKKMEKDFDVEKERECLICFYDLYLSAASCKCSPDQFSCLKHANQFCSCEIDNRFVLLRYSMTELNKLVDILEGQVDAANVWESDDLGFVSTNKVVSVSKLDVESDTYERNSHGQRERSFFLLENREKLNINVPCMGPPSCSHVSSEVIQSESQHGSFSLGTSHMSIDCHNSVVNDETTFMNTEGKVGQDCCIDLNLNIICNEDESGLLVISDCFNSKSCTEEEKTCTTDCKQEIIYISDTTSKPDIMQHESDCNLSVSPVLVNKDDPLCSRDVQHSCSIRGNKLFGVDILSLRSHSKVPSYSLLEREPMDTPDVKIFNGSYPMKKWDPCIETIKIGTVMFGRLWCSKQAIFPKGIPKTHIA